MSATQMLVVAAAVFVGSHLALSHPLRAPLVRMVGEGGFAGLFSLTAAVSLGWVVVAYRATPVVAPAHVPGDVGWAVASAAMWFASVLFAGSLARNPALPGPGAATAALRDARGVFAITRHPMNWSFALWALVHAGLWPTPANSIVTTAILILALVGSWGQDAKKTRLMGDGWRGWMRRTSFLPFAGQLFGRTTWSAAWPGSVAIAAGTVIWLVATWSHQPLGGALAAGIWRWI